MTADIHKGAELAVAAANDEDGHVARAGRDERAGLGELTGVRRVLPRAPKDSLLLEARNAGIEVPVVRDGAEVGPRRHCPGILAGSASLPASSAPVRR